MSCQSIEFFVISSGCLGRPHLCIDDREGMGRIKNFAVAIYREKVSSLNGAMIILRVFVRKFLHYLTVFINNDAVAETPSAFTGL